AAGPAPAARRALTPRSLWWRRWLDSDHRTARPRQRFAAADMSLRVDRHRRGRRRISAERRVNALDSCCALLSPHHDTCGAGGGTLIRAGDLHVLVAGIDEEPAAISICWRANDFAILRTPLRLTHLFCAGQRRPFEGPVWDEG